MATIQYDDLLPYILPEVHGCSDPLAEQAIRDAAIEFCRRSRIWVVICDAADVVAGQANYDIDVPADAALVQILSIRLAGKDLIDPSNTDKLDAYHHGEWDTETGQPRFYTQVNDDEFLCSPVPVCDQSGGLLVRLLAKPSRASTSYPNWINERYQDAIVAGAKARLMMKQGQPWYNPNQAAAYQMDFDEGVGTATEDAARSLTRAQIRTTPHN